MLQKNGIMRTVHLYFYQPGGGAPAGTIEYKARNYGFDVRGKNQHHNYGTDFHRV